MAFLGFMLLFPSDETFFNQIKTGLQKTKTLWFKVFNSGRRIFNFFFIRGKKLSFLFSLLAFSFKDSQ